MNLTVNPQHGTAAASVKMRLSTGFLVALSVTLALSVVWGASARWNSTPTASMKAELHAITIAQFPC